MTFTVGQRVRFHAMFRDESGPVDPVSVEADVVVGGRPRHFTLAAGQVRRSAPGSYFVEVVMDEPGVTDVRFASTAANQEAWQDAKFEVYEANQIDQTHAQMHTDDASDLELDPGLELGQEVDESELERADAERASLIEDLRARGLRVPEGASDAYLSGAARAARGTGNAREAYLRRQRGQ